MILPKVRTMDFGDEVNLKVQYTESDVTSAMYSDSFRRPLFWAGIVLPALVLSFSGNGLSRIAGVSVTVLLTIAIPYLRARWIMKTTAVRGAVLFTFSSRGIEAEFVNGHSSAEWALVYGVRENSKIISMKARGMLHLIPKRQIDAVHLEGLREILRRNMKKDVSLLGAAEIIR